MVVRIRLARHGSRNNPFYHLVAIRDKAARNARPIEKLGEYDPIPRPKQNPNQPVQAWQNVGMSSSLPSSSFRNSDLEKPILTSGLEKFDTTELEKRIEWNVKRIHHWLSVGAQPSKPVARLLDRAGLIPEGKWYKGMYRNPTDTSKVASVTMQSQETASEQTKKLASETTTSTDTTTTKSTETASLSSEPAGESNSQTAAT